MTTDRKVKDDDLVKMFDRFDNKMSSEVISNDTLRQIKNSPNWDRTFVDKVKIMKQMIKNIEKKVNSSLSLGTSKISIDSSFIFSANNNMPLIKTRLSTTQLGGSAQIPVSDVSIPLIKLINMPAFEIYALYSGVINSAIATKNTGKENKLRNVNLLKQDISNLNEIDDINDSSNNINFEDKKKRAILLLTKYFNSFFENIKMNGFNDYDEIAKLVATQIIDGKSPEEVNKILGITFNIKSLEDEALQKVAVFSDQDVNELRIDCAYQKAINLMNSLKDDPSKEVEALSAVKQYEALVSTSLSKDFSRLIDTQENGVLKINGSLKTFCENYVETFMKSNNLKPIQITYKNEGELGTYIDDGKEGKININLTKISSVTELVSTLSHELTHAVASSKNKVEGNTTKDGFGLTDNISSDLPSVIVSRASKEAKELLIKLNHYCYHINPNERQSRYGEISALKFMSEQLATKEKIKDQLHETIRNFGKYQNNTIKILEELSDPKVIDSFEAQVSRLDTIGEPEEVVKLMVERLNYIKKIMRTKEASNLSMEEESIQIASELNQKKVLFSEQEPQM